jgi:hypothetical protein
MKAITPSVRPAPTGYGDSDLMGLRTTDVSGVGMVIRKPPSYPRVINNLPTGRALRRLLAKHNRNEKAAFGEAASSKSKGKSQT